MIVFGSGLILKNDRQYMIRKFFFILAVLCGTVADALAALRVAAKLVSEDEEAIGIGDVDKDGHVTVADALAILRVAAKLVDSL